MSDNKHYDYFDREITMDAQVVFTAPKYRHLVTGTVYGFTPKCVRVKYLNDWNYGTKGCEQTYLSDPSFLVLAPDELQPKSENAYVDEKL